MCIICIEYEHERMTEAEVIAAGYEAPSYIEEEHSSDDVEYLLELVAEDMELYGHNED